MAFSEKSQAFLAAKYYEYLAEAFGERGKQAFIHAVKHYAMQRGSRMAQRAIHDGAPLNYETFCRYGEWTPSREALETETASVMEVKTLAPDFEYSVARCPWYMQFEEMGAQEAGMLYCAYLDEAMNRGFHSETDFHTKQTRYHGDECIFVINNAGLTPDSQMGMERIEKYVKGFDYHCAHVYYSFGEMVTAIFDEEGQDVCRKVLETFEEQYGREMRQQMEAYGGTNFNCI